MKIIESDNYLKTSKSKYPKSETEPYNPWAVCTDEVGRENKDKYERCVHHIKDQNRKDSKLEDKKDAKRPSYYRDDDSYDDSQHYLNDQFQDKINYQGSDKKEKDDDDYYDNLLKTKLKKQLVNSFVIEAKKK